MRKSRFSEEQIVRIIQEYAAGAKVSELCRKHGMSDATFYKWKARYGGLQISDVRRLKDLESENGKLNAYSGISAHLFRQHPPICTGVSAQL